MRRLEGKEACAHAIYLSEAAEAAAYSLCLKARCGAAIVKDGQVITTGYNAPPDKKRPDYCLKELLPEGFKSDRHCCIHAEAEAIWQALLNHENKEAQCTSHAQQAPESSSLQESHTAQNAARTQSGQE